MELGLGIPGTQPSKITIEKMVSLYGNKIYKLAYHMTGSTHNAEEIVQNVFLKLFSSWNNLAPPRNISSWIYRIVSNASIDLLRSQQARSKKEQTMDCGAVDSILSPRAELEPSQVLEQKEFQQKLQEVLDELSPQQRTALILFDHEGLKGKEIAEILKVKEATIRRYIFEARSKVKTLLASYI